MGSMSAQMTQEESKLLNEAIFEKLASRDPLLEKQAVDAVNDFTRTKMREDGFYRRIIPPLPISNDELDRQVDTELIRFVQACLQNGGLHEYLFGADGPDSSRRGMGCVEGESFGHQIGRRADPGKKSVGSPP